MAAEGLQAGAAPASPTMDPTVGVVAPWLPAGAAAGGVLGTDSTSRGSLHGAGRGAADGPAPAGPQRLPPAGLADVAVAMAR